MANALRMVEGAPSTIPLLFLAAVAALIACGTDPTSVTVQDVVGDYEATELVLEDIDFLAEGGRLQLSLRADSTVSGELYVPEMLGGPLSLDMAGTFRVRDGFVTFSQPVPTFVSGIPFRWSGGVLAVAWEQGDQSGRVRLQRE